MIIKVKKGHEKEEIDSILKGIKPRKRFNSRKYLGKVKWNEDPVAYQRRLRDEWD
jgi:hypothetical protein